MKTKPPPLTASEKSLRAKVAALTRWSKEDPAANAARGQAGLVAKLLDQVDPNRELPEAERNRRLEAARKAHMAKLSLASARARRLRSHAAQIEAEVTAELSELREAS